MWMLCAARVSSSLSSLSSSVIRALSSPPCVEALFAEDDEFNQGQFVECVRDQMLAERLEYFVKLEEMLYNITGWVEVVTRDQVEAVRRARVHYAVHTRPTAAARR